MAKKFVDLSDYPEPLGKIQDIAVELQEQGVGEQEAISLMAVAVAHYAFSTMESVDYAEKTLRTAIAGAKMDYL
ncbi:hypothetical protein EP232_00675 [bacterium]|nr:MAG: hypothetical protein EP232_00675 [bacterium]